ncbi:AAA family ATPase [Thalassobacillus sp. C254]|uniref:AAA family ATPase n=1 Tax=Thalassobacillus sp. C254 TaxID=1225341 RepID=UPI0006D14BCC|nr:AAA family ATPase [Thalassobacillus sp. C254]
MYIESVKINNFKSIGNKKNILELNQDLIAIIGKNETGKSNILEAVGKLPQVGKPNANYFNNRNLNRQEDICVSIRMSSRKEDEFIEEDTFIKYQKGSSPALEGGLSAQLSKDEHIKQLTQKVLSFKQDRKVWNIDANSSIHKTVMEFLENYNVMLPINIKNNFSKLKDSIKDTYSQKEELIQDINSLEDRLNDYYLRIPKFFYRKTEDQLKSVYDLKEIKQLLNKEGKSFRKTFKSR